MLSGVVLVSCVDLKPREVAIGAVCGNPHLDPMLGWFQWHILFQRWSTLKLDHCLINSNVTVGLVGLSELGELVVNQWSDLPETVMAIVFIWYQCVVVDKVEIPWDLKESVLSDAISHWNIPKTGISWPLVVEGRKMVYAHQNTKSQERLQLLHCYLRPFVILLVSHCNLCICIAFIYYSFH